MMFIHCLYIWVIGFGFKQEVYTTLQVCLKEKSFSSFQSSSSFFPKLFSVDFKALLFFLTEFHLSLNFNTSYSTL